MHRMSKRSVYICIRLVWSRIVERIALVNLSVHFKVLRRFWNKDTFFLRDNERNLSTLI